MNILFIVLKIIGILLCVILFLVLLLLLHPVFYSVKGEVEEEVSIKGSVWWLFQILRLEFQYEEEFTYQIRIFGIRKEASSKADSEECQEPKSESGPKERTGTQTDDLNSMESSSADNTAVEEPVDHNRSLARADKRHRGRNMIDFFSVLKQEISDDKNRMAVAHIWKELRYLLRHLKPNYIRADMSFSTGDPASTGEVIGVISLIPMVYQYPVKIAPDFLSDEPYVRGRFALKGRIALLHLVCCAGRLFADRNVKRLIYKLRK